MEDKKDKPVIEVVKHHKKDGFDWSEFKYFLKKYYLFVLIIVLIPLVLYSLGQQLANFGSAAPRLKLQGNSKVGIQTELPKAPDEPDCGLLGETCCSSTSLPPCLDSNLICNYNLAANNGDIDDVCEPCGGNNELCCTGNVCKEGLGCFGAGYQQGICLAEGANLSMYTENRSLIVNQQVYIKLGVNVRGFYYNYTWKCGDDASEQFASAGQFHEISCSFSEPGPKTIHGGVTVKDINNKVVAKDLKSSLQVNVVNASPTNQPATPTAGNYYSPTPRPTIMPTRIPPGGFCGAGGTCVSGYHCDWDTETCVRDAIPTAIYSSPTPTRRPEPTKNYQ